MCEYMSGGRRARSSRAGVKYFDEFRTHFWERPEDSFDRIRNINISNCRRNRRNSSSTPSIGEVEQTLGQRSSSRRRRWMKQSKEGAVHSLETFPHIITRYHLYLLRISWELLIVNLIRWWLGSWSRHVCSNISWISPIIIIMGQRWSLRRITRWRFQMYTTQLIYLKINKVFFGNKQEEGFNLYL